MVLLHLYGGGLCEYTRYSEFKLYKTLKGDAEITLFKQS